LQEHGQVEVVGTALDGIEALDLVRGQKPDVLVLDLDMPKISGLDVLRAVVEDPSLVTRILVLTASVDPEDTYQAMKHGAKGYLSKRADWDAVADAILRVYAGATVIDNLCSASLAERLAKKESPVPKLTGREQEVLQMVAVTPSYKAAGSRLGMNARTVETHMRNVYRKLEVKSKAEAVMRGIKLGLIQP
jgi:DNA-binding NarL/FixJ family response regulator